MKKTHLFIVAGSALLAVSCASAIAISNISPNNSSGNVDPSDVGGGGDNPVSPTDGDLTVTFDFNGGKYKGGPTATFENVVPTSYFYYIKKEINTQQITYPTHYTSLRGYSLSATDSINLVADDYVIKDNITFYAQYETTESQCEVKWVDGFNDSGEVILTEKYFENDVPSFKGAYPFHEGYAFDRWDPAIHAVTESELTTGVTYTAKYLPAGLYHTVTIDPNNETGSSITQSVADNGYAIEPKVTYTGHHLDKWVYKTGDKQDQEFKFDTKITEDLSIKATWLLDSCNITYVANGGTFASAPTPTVDYGKTITTKPQFQDRGGYDKELVAWYTNDAFTGDAFIFGGEGVGTQVTTDLTLFAKWPDIKSAKYNFYDGDSPITTIPEQTVKYGEKVHRPADPDKEGYTFDGWYAEKELTTEFNFDTPATCEEANVKIYAKFTPITYRVTYNAMGGTILNPSVGYDDVGYRGKIDVAPTLERPGYKLDEVVWHVGSTAGQEFKFGQTEGTEVTSNLTLYATWGEIKKYTVTFYDDQETPQPIPGLEQTVNYGDKVQRPVNPTKTGYTFSGWYTEAALTNEYNFDTQLTAEETTLSLYAKFTVNTCRVTLNPNGGVITGQDVYTVNYGGTIETAPTVTKEDCAQPTWYTSPTCEAQYEFKFGAKGTGTEVTEDITIYAKYEIKAGESFVSDSWKVFLNEINGKSYTQIASSDAYKDEYASIEGGKKENTFVGLSRQFSITDISGNPTTYSAIIVDENRSASESEGKFTFMFVSNDTCSFDRVKNYYYNSDLANYIDKLSYGIQDELKGAIKSSSQDCYSTYPEQKDVHNFKLFTPSATQIFGESGTTPVENAQFAYFVGDAQTKAAMLNDTWLRTPYEGTQGYSYYVDGGVKTAEAITATHKICAAFVI